MAFGEHIHAYVWNGWAHIAVIEGGVISFVRADHIGRPVFATNASGVKVWSATYPPFGVSVRPDRSAAVRWCGIVSTNDSGHYGA